MALEFIDRLKDLPSSAVTESCDFRGDASAVVRRDAWQRTFEFLKNECSFDMLIDLCGADYPLRAERFEVVAHLRRTKDGKRLRIKTRCPEEDPIVPSLSGVYPAANWFEREAFDLFGIRFSNHPNLKRILCHDKFEGHALRKDFPKDRRGKIPSSASLLDEVHHEEKSRNSRVPYPAFRVTSHESRVTNKMFLNLGPSHPAMHGCFRVMLELDGEKIINAIPEIGYLHRCFEKEAETHAWHSIIPYADRLNYVSPIMNGVGLCMAIEKLFDIEIPERAKWVRMLASEVSRISDHLVAVGTNLVDVGALSNFWYLFNAREKFTDWIEALCGARLTANYACIGGVQRDLPPATARQLREGVKELRRAISHVSGLIKKNRIFIDRTQGVGAISEREAIGFGFTGPCLRATGSDYDVRKAHPYYFYDKIDWDIPIGHNGDTYDRIFVRIEEMEQSARIIEQILDKISQGPVLADRPDIVLPPPHEVYGSIEGTIRQFKIVTEGICPPAGEVYSYTEAANGELGFYIVSDGSAAPYRIKVRPPCFAIYQAYPQLIKGHMIADAVAIIGSLNVIAGELDR